MWPEVKPVPGSAWPIFSGFERWQQARIRREHRTAREGAAPVYVEPDPVYVRRCYWSYGEAYWDDWQGRWRRPRMRVCD